MARVLSDDLAGDFAELRDAQAGLVTVTSAFRYLGESAVRWRLERGRWRRAGPGVLVTQSGPLTGEHRLWVPLLAAGAGAVLAGLTAARLDGLTGFEDPRIYMLIPASRRVRQALPGGAPGPSWPPGCRSA